MKQPEGSIGLLTERGSDGLTHMLPRGVRLL
jgi:hypothetical protein